MYAIIITSKSKNQLEKMYAIIIRYNYTTQSRSQILQNKNDFNPTIIKFTICLQSS